MVTETGQTGRTGRTGHGPARPELDAGCDPGGGARGRGERGVGRWSEPPSAPADPGRAPVRGRGREAAGRGPPQAQCAQAANLSAVAVDQAPGQTRHRARPATRRGGAASAGKGSPARVPFKFNIWNLCTSDKSDVKSISDRQLALLTTQ